MANNPATTEGDPPIAVPDALAKHVVAHLETGGDDKSINPQQQAIYPIQQVRCLEENKLNCVTIKPNFKIDFTVAAL